MSRKERRLSAEKKRNQLVCQMCDMLLHEYEKEKNFSNAVAYLKLFVLSEIESRPQDKTLILQAADKFETSMVEKMTKYMNAT